ncbi:MAG: hypothetical protein N3A71_02485 [Candidatus Dojkabacteria bacterium]|nr:hypothetical protein [Candidatus Dojkabacteria bacterium]
MENRREGCVFSNVRVAIPVVLAAIAHTLFNVDIFTAGIYFTSHFANYLFERKVTPFMLLALPTLFVLSTQGIIDHELTNYLLYHITAGLFTSTTLKLHAGSFLTNVVRSINGWFAKL